MQYTCFVISPWQVSLPKSCFDASTDASDLLPAGDADASPTVGEWEDPGIPKAYKCSYDSQIYADGDSWRPEESSLACVTCSCKVRQREK